MCAGSEQYCIVFQRVGCCMACMTGPISNLGLEPHGAYFGRRNKMLAKIVRNVLRNFIVSSGKNYYQNSIVKKYAKIEK